MNFVRGKKEIEKQNSEWIKDHFSNYRKVNNIERVTGPKIKIEVWDTMKAIDRMGKNKAASSDELLDTIF